MIGLVSGMTGTGGGVFLAPVILMMGWANARETAAITAVYNLVNSAGALLGAWSIWNQLAPAIPLWLAAVVLGGTIGAAIGARFYQGGRCACCSRCCCSSAGCGCWSDHSAACATRAGRNAATA